MTALCGRAADVAKLVDMHGQLRVGREIHQEQAKRELFSLANERALTEPEYSCMRLRTLKKAMLTTPDALSKATFPGVARMCAMAVVVLLIMRPMHDP